MLIYIYMNQRVLDRNNSVLLGDPAEKTQEEQVQLEDILLQFLQEEGGNIEDENTEIIEVMWWETSLVMYSFVQLRKLYGKLHCNVMYRTAS